MTRIGFALLMALASAALLATTMQGHAFDSDNDTGWGAPYNSHLDPYDGRPLGPPLATLPPGYQYYNGRLIRVPYPGPGAVYVPRAVPPRAVRPHRAPSRVSAARRR